MCSHSCVVELEISTPNLVHGPYPNMTVIRSRPRFGDEVSAFDERVRACVFFLHDAHTE